MLTIINPSKNKYNNLYNMNILPKKYVYIFVVYYFISILEIIKFKTFFRK